MRKKIFNKEQKQIFEHIKKYHLEIINEYKILANWYSIYKSGRTSSSDKLIMKLFVEIFTKTIEEIENSEETIKMEQWLISDEMTSLFWYPTNFWKTSYACKWNDSDTWKQYKKVRYKKVLLKDLVKQLLMNFPVFYGKKDEWKRIDYSNGWSWKLLGHLFIWSDDRDIC